MFVSLNSRLESNKEEEEKVEGVGVRVLTSRGAIALSIGGSGESAANLMAATCVNNLMWRETCVHHGWQRPWPTWDTARLALMHFYNVNVPTLCKKYHTVS